MKIASEPITIKFNDETCILQDNHLTSLLHYETHQERLGESQNLIDEFMIQKTGCGWFSGLGESVKGLGSNVMNNSKDCYSDFAGFFGRSSYVFYTGLLAC